MTTKKFWGPIVKILSSKYMAKSVVDGFIEYEKEKQGGRCIACGRELVNMHEGDPLYAVTYHCPIHGPVGTRLGSPNVDGFIKAKCIPDNDKED